MSLLGEEDPDLLVPCVGVDMAMMMRREQELKRNKECSVEKRYNGRVHDRYGRFSEAKTEARFPSRVQHDVPWTWWLEEKGSVCRVRFNNEQLATACF